MGGGNFFYRRAQNRVRDLLALMGKRENEHYSLASKRSEPHWQAEGLPCGGNLVVASKSPKL